MTNLYVGMFRDVLKGYLAKAKAVANELKSNNEKFSPEYASKENEKSQAKAIQYYTDAKNSINSIFEDVRSYLAIANFPNVEDLTADRLLFAKDSNINLTAEEVKGFVERYTNNYTMLRVIKDWLHTNHEGMTEYTGVAITINMPSDVLAVYKKFADSALSLIDSIYNNADTFNELSLSAYADENFGASLFAVIGNGMGLSDYKSKRVPESAKHCFDNVMLALDNNAQIHNAPSSFSFASVSKA